jgi:biopolymer transport protein ExbD
MGKNKKSMSATDDVEEINISPLIDMVFILLIFFIVTTVFVEEPGVDVVKPFAYNAEDLAKNCIMIAVTESDNIFYGGEEVGLAGIRVKVRRMIKENESYPVIIQADIGATNGTVARLIDECKLAEVPASNIHLSLERLNN